MVTGVPNLQIIWDHCKKLPDSCCKVIYCLKFFIGAVYSMCTRCCFFSSSPCVNSEVITSAVKVNMIITSQGGVKILVDKCKHVL